MTNKKTKQNMSKAQGVRNLPQIVSLRANPVPFSILKGGL
jgi:hypothetical protein